MKLIRIMQNIFSFEEIPYENLMDGTFNKSLKPYIEIVDVNVINSENVINPEDEQNNIMKKIMDILNHSIGNTNCHVHKCYENFESCVYIFYIPSETTIVGHENNIGTFLSEKHEPVIGDCVILNTESKLVDEKFVSKNIDMTLTYLFEIIRSRFIHKAIIITPENEIKEHIFIDNPITNTFLLEKSSRCYHVNFMHKVFCVFMAYEPEDNKFNKFATIFCKRLKVHGGVIISMLSQLPFIEVNDLTETTFKKILCIRSNMSDTDINTKIDDAVKNNFYNLLDNAIIKFDNRIVETIPDDVLHGVTMNSTLDAH